AATTGKPTVEQVLTTLVFSPDGTRLVTGARDDTIRLWDVTRGEQILGEDDRKKLATSTSYTTTQPQLFSFYTGVYGASQTSVNPRGTAPALNTNGTAPPPDGGFGIGGSPGRGGPGGGFGGGGRLDFGFRPNPYAPIGGPVGYGGGTGAAMDYY